MRLRFLALIILALSLLPPGAFAAPLFAPTAQRTDPSPPFDAAMRPAFVRDVERADLPRYLLDLAIDPQARRLSGRMRLEFRNTTGVPLRDVVLRLYQHFPPDIFGDGGDVRMDISEIVAQGSATQGMYEARRTVLRVPLPAPVAPDESIVLSLRYSANIVSWAPRDGTFALPAFYPMLAVWQNGWRADITRFPDRVFAEAALYAATITVPEGYTVVASGSTVSTATREGRTTFEVVTGPMREFAISVGRFAVARAAHDGIEVNVWHRPGIGLESAARQVALHAAASLLSLESRFGAYPYRELDIHLLSAGRNGNVVVYQDGTDMDAGAWTAMLLWRLSPDAEASGYAYKARPRGLRRSSRQRPATDAARRCAWKRPIQDLAGVLDTSRQAAMRNRRGQQIVPDSMPDEGR